jgi:hypothetical protein
MSKIHVIRNEDVNQILIGTPEDHKHLRVCMKLKNESTIIFQEATIANISRAYITIKTHPNIQAQELKIKPLTEDSRKEGYATHQLLETCRKNKDIKRELKKLLKRAEVSI